MVLNCTGVDPAGAKVSLVPRLRGGGGGGGGGAGNEKSSVICFHRFDQCFRTYTHYYWSI